MIAGKAVHYKQSASLCMILYSTAHMYPCSRQSQLQPHNALHVLFVPQRIESINNALLMRQFGLLMLWLWNHIFLRLHPPVCCLCYNVAWVPRCAACTGG